MRSVTDQCQFDLLGRGKAAPIFLLTASHTAIAPTYRKEYDEILVKRQKPGGNGHDMINMRDLHRLRNGDLRKPFFKINAYWLADGKLYECAALTQEDSMEKNFNGRTHMEG